MDLSHDVPVTSGATPAPVLSLAGRTALITGGSRGIGAAAVRLFCAAGARVAFSYRAAREQAEALVRDCGGPERCIALRQELATIEDGESLVNASVHALGRLDALVANHGVWPAHEQPIASMPATQWRRTLGVNLDSVFGLVRTAVAAMEAQSASESLAVARAGHTSGPVPGGAVRDTVLGHIVLVASTAAQRGEALHADYAASKGALLSLTKSLSSELAPRGILANCVAPGWVATEMSAGALADAEMGARVRASIPVGRPATPEEIAGPVLFLCTPWAGFISGEVLNVNGGAVLVG